MSLDPSSGMDKTIADLYRLKKYKRYFKYIALGLIGISLILVFLWPYLEQVPVLLFNQKFMNGRLQVGKIDLKRKFVENPKFIAGWLVICMPLLYIIDNDGLHRDDYDVIQGENDY